MNSNGSAVKAVGLTNPMRPTNGSLLSPRSPIQSSFRSGDPIQFTPGHKRTATGDIKPIPSGVMAPQTSDVNGIRRHRSKSMGLSAHENRIAQLSVHIRTRLSYAAAKIEMSRQPRGANLDSPLHGLAALSPSNSQTPSGVHSAPTSNSTSHPRRVSPNGTPRASTTHNRSQSVNGFPGKLPPIPKLAPPVDIISSNEDTRRRRPNTNASTKSFEQHSYSHHRRHHSHQDNSNSQSFHRPPQMLGSMTPSIPHAEHTEHGRLSTKDDFHRHSPHSQSTSMEQDAIETLMFMSSPENSGYRSSPRSLQLPSTQASLDSFLSSNMNRAPADQSQGSQSLNSDNRSLPLRTAGLGLEVHAGDEIDRILDQMESDSEDDERFASHRCGPRLQVPSKGYNMSGRDS